MTCCVCVLTVGSTISSAGTLYLTGPGPFAGNVTCMSGGRLNVTGSVGALNILSGCVIVNAHGNGLPAFTAPAASTVNLYNSVISRGITTAGSLTFHSGSSLAATYVMVGQPLSTITFRPGSTLSGQVTTAGTLNLMPGCDITSSAVVVINTGSILSWYEISFDFDRLPRFWRVESCLVVVVVRNGPFLDDTQLVINGGRFTLYVRALSCLC